MTAWFLWVWRGCGLLAFLGCRQGCSWEEGGNPIYQDRFGVDPPTQQPPQPGHMVSWLNFSRMLCLLQV
jgi:hypothetical protein